MAQLDVKLNPSKSTITAGLKTSGIVSYIAGPGIIIDGRIIKADFTIISTATNLKNGVGTKSIQQNDGTETFINDYSAVGIEIGEVVQDIPGEIVVDAENNKLTVTNGAFGESSAIFGGKSLAHGKRALAEGTSTLAIGNYSHAEGNATVARAAEAHTEGLSTVAYGIGSHAEGTGTVATGLFSHTEGTGTFTTGNYAHAEGDHTEATSSAAHSEGLSTTASGPYSHAEGSNNTASGSSSHAEGLGNTASGNVSHVEGQYNDANGKYGVHIEGLSNIASKGFQTVIGQYNDFDHDSDAIFVVGNGEVIDETVIRKDAFQVLTDGSAKVGRDVTSSDADLTVATKKYVDDHTTSYTGGYGITIAGNEISIDQQVVAEKSDIQEERQSRQQRDNELSQAIQDEADTRAEYDTALNNRIDSLESRGRFLSTWNATTGLPNTYPTIPATETGLTYTYTYRAGDYYIINNVGATNKKPTGSSITATRTTTTDPWTWTIGSTTETEAVSNNGTYTYDGTNWVLMGAGAAAAWGSIGGNIADQTDLNNTFVHKSGTETITGAKTFTTNVTIATADETTRKYDFEIIDNYYLAINNKTGSATDRLAYWNPTGTMFTAKTIPMTTNTYDLGESDHKWKDLYLQGKLNLTNAANTHTWVAQAYGDWGIALDRDATRVYTFEYGALFNSQNADLGQPGNKRWRDLYLSRNLTDGTNSVSVSNIVTTDTAQEISGEKTFTTDPRALKDIWPAEYQAVDYIISDGNQAINTCWKPTSKKLRVETKFMCLADMSTKSVCGSETSDTGARWLFTLYGQNNAERQYVLMGSWNNQEQYITTPLNTAVTVSIDYNDGFMAVNSDQGDNWTHTQSGDNITAHSLPLYLFQNASNQRSSIRLYYYKIWDNDILVRYFVPSYRKSDNKIGLYDLVSGVFFARANSSSTDFTKGSDITIDQEYSNYVTHAESVNVNGEQAIFGKKTFVNDFRITSPTSINGGTYSVGIQSNYYLGIYYGIDTEKWVLSYWNPDGVQFTRKMRPISNNLYDIGQSDCTYKDLYLSGSIKTSGTGNLILDPNYNWVMVKGDTVPFSNNVMKLGAPNLKWKELYLSGELKDGTNSISIADIVDKNTTQTITGNKTFTSINGSSSQTDKYLHVNNNNQLEWVTGTGGNYVTIDTNQTITGVKTFDNDVRLTQGKILTFEDSSYTALVRNETGILTINPNDASPTDKYCFNSAALYPSVTAAKDLGTSSTKWKDLYLSGNLTDGTNSVSIAAISTDKLPTVVNDKYLHTNATTGALEWSDASGGGGVTKYLHQVTIGAYPSSTVATMTFSLNIFNTSNTTITTHAQLCAAMTLNVEYPASGRIKSKGTYMYQVTKCKKIDDSVITVYYNRLNPANPDTYTELTYDSANLTIYGDNVA